MTLKRIGSRLTYANVMATMAVFLVGARRRSGLFVFSGVQHSKQTGPSGFAHSGYGRS